ncbi:MAG TPA: hypothetical protein VIL26_06220 [Clostridia bacterium]
MKKTLRDLARYLNEILVPQTQENYAINPVYTDALLCAEQDIREGVGAFRSFLARLYDTLYDKGDVYDISKKNPHGNENRTTLSIYYPFLHNLRIILIRIGYFGVLDQNEQALVCGNNVFNEKQTVAKNLECLRFLSDCGLSIEGMDINLKKQDLKEIKTIKITYPDNPAMLTGMKVMAISEGKYGTLVNQDVFLRCDYRAIKKDKTDELFILKDTIRSLSLDVQNFILHLHQRYLDKGLKCVVEIKGFHVYIKYCYKRQDVWGINASLNNGYHINVKPTKINEYAEIIKAFPEVLQKIIEKGYGCGRKRKEIGHCDGGCHGLHIPLDDSVLDIKNHIETWFDQEVEFLKKK